MTSFRSIFDYRKEGAHALDHNVVCNVGSLDEARGNGDLARWAAWVATSAIDYLEDE